MDDKDIDEVEQIAEKIVEKFESVIILVSNNEEGKTRSYAARRGNYFASKGLIIEWLENERNIELARKLDRD